MMSSSDIQQQRGLKGIPTELAAFKGLLILSMHFRIITPNNFKWVQEKYLHSLF